MLGNITANEVTQEAHYYPFGMRIEATDGFVATLANAIPYLYNGIEHIGDLGLNINTAFYRTLDPALGRWWQIDPKAEAFYALSPYNSMGNNPLFFNDKDGDFILAPILVGAAIGGIINLGFQAVQGNINSPSDALKAFGVGALAGAAAVAVPQALGVAWGYGLTTATGAVASGAVPGAISSATSGVITGVGNTLFFGYDKTKSVSQNIGKATMNGIIGGISGGIAGGVIGGLVSKYQGHSFWGTKAKDMPHYSAVPKFDPSTGKYDSNDIVTYKNVYDQASGFREYTAVLDHSTGQNTMKFIGMDVTDPSSGAPNYLISKSEAAKLWDFMGGRGIPMSHGKNFMISSGVPGSFSLQRVIYYGAATSTQYPSIAVQHTDALGKYLGVYMKFRFIP